MAGTAFKEIYNKFKAKITDDMFMELTPGETDGLLKELFLNSLHNFEFPRVNIYDYNESLEEYHIYLTTEEQNIIATYMIVEWLSQQLASVENTRMKYSGSDFKFTSQANHMAKLQAMKKDYERRAFHLQRLYKRRRMDNKGIMRSTFSSIMDSTYQEPLFGNGLIPPASTDLLTKEDVEEVMGDALEDFWGRLDENKNKVVDKSDISFTVEMTDF
jgi:hypothetical protein